MKHTVSSIDSLGAGVTVYCGSCPGADPAFIAGARGVGAALARAGVPLIYGGGRMGLMNATAAAARAAGGVTLAVIPRFMVERGWNDPDSTHTLVTEDMSVRKQTFAARSRGVIALPGGIGTMEELAEIITWRQLGLFGGNIVILNTHGYWDSFLGQLSAAVAQGFMPEDHTALWEVTDDPDRAVGLALHPAAPMHLHRKF